MMICLIHSDIKDISGRNLIEMVLSNEENRTRLDIPPPSINTTHQTGHYAGPEPNPVVNERNTDRNYIRRRLSVSPSILSEANSGESGHKQRTK